MSDTSAFIAGCATTGAAALMLLLARISVGESPASVETLESLAAQEAIVPVPAPPPPAVSGTSAPADDDLQEQLQDQQSSTERLEAQLSQQALIIQDLKSQIEQQQQAVNGLTARLSSYEASVNVLTTQQQQTTRVQHEADKAQSSLLWVGAGLVMVVLVGGALVLVILVVLVAFQSRSTKSSPSSQIVYSTEVPVGPNPYYQRELLPPASRPRRVYPQDVYDYE